MNMKTEDIYRLSQVVLVYASLKGFPGKNGEPDRKHDFEARYRSGQLLKSLRAILQELEGHRGELLDEYYLPVDPAKPSKDEHGNEIRFVIPGKEKEADIAVKAFNDAEHETKMSKIKKLDLMHPDVTGAMMIAFEDAGLVEDTDAIQEPKQQAPQ
jgi:hypothetical protein